MYKLNFIAVVGIVAAVSFAVGMASPAAVAFAAQHENIIMNMDDNTSPMGNMSGGGNSTTSITGNITGTENITTAGETGYPSGDDETGCDTNPCSGR